MKDARAHMRVRAAMPHMLVYYRCAPPAWFIHTRADLRCLYRHMYEKRHVLSRPFESPARWRLSLIFFCRQQRWRGEAGEPRHSYRQRHAPLQRRDARCCQICSFSRLHEPLPLMVSRADADAALLLRRVDKKSHEPLPAAKGSDAKRVRRPSRRRYHRHC